MKTNLLEVVGMAGGGVAAAAKRLASLRGGGRPIATMELLIATAAIVDEAAIVTRNTRHFGRVPGLEIRGY